MKDVRKNTASMKKKNPPQDAKRNEYSNNKKEPQEIKTRIAKNIFKELNRGKGV